MHGQYEQSARLSGRGSYQCPYGNDCTFKVDFFYSIKTQLLSFRFHALKLVAAGEMVRGNIYMMNSDSFISLSLLMLLIT